MTREDEKKYLAQKKAEKDIKDRRDTIDHTLYEFKRILEQKGIEE